MSMELKPFDKLTGTYPGHHHRVIVHVACHQANRRLNSPGRYLFPLLWVNAGAVSFPSLLLKMIMQLNWTRRWRAAWGPNPSPQSKQCPLVRRSNARSLARAAQLPKGKHK
eukprot:scaffold11550_cov30-Prasinocladus_malaysianus.AAC.1